MVTMSSMPPNGRWLEKVAGTGWFKLPRAGGEYRIKVERMGDGDE